MSYFDDQVYKAKRDTADELSNIRRLLYMKECRDAGVIDEDEWERFLMSATEKGSAQRIADHVSVVERVFAAWDDAGLLTQWGAELTGWSVDYVLYAALRQPLGSERRAALRRLAALYNTYGRGSGAPRAVRRLVRLVASGAYDAPQTRMAAVLWRVWRYGVRDLVETVVGHGGGRSDGENCGNVGKRIRDICGSGVAIHGFEFLSHDFVSPLLFMSKCY